MKIEIVPWQQLSDWQKKEILRLDGQMPFAWPLSEWDLLPDRFELFFSQLPDGAFSGFALWEYLQWEDYAHLHKIVVEEKLRRAGCGRQLLELSINHLEKNKSCRRFGLEVSAQNFAAQEFYQSSGWKKLNRVTSYYSSGEDAVRYILER